MADPNLTGSFFGVGLFHGFLRGLLPNETKPAFVDRRRAYSAAARF